MVAASRWPAFRPRYTEFISLNVRDYARIGKQICTLWNRPSTPSVSVGHPTLSLPFERFRKHGFSVIQDPLAAQQTEDAQVRQSHEAACVLLGLPPTSENLGHQVVQGIGTELRENGAIAAQQLRARGFI